MAPFSPGRFVQQMLRRIWWLLLLRGGWGISFGALAIIPRDFPTVAGVVSAYVVVDGALAMALGRSRMTADDGLRHPLWPLLLSGWVSMVSGIAALMAIDSVHSLTLLAIGLFARGLFDVLAALVLRDAGYDERLLGLAGTSTLVAGIIGTTCDPQSIVWRILLAALVGTTGCVIAALGIRVRMSRAPVVIYGHFSRSPAAATAMHQLRTATKPPVAAR